jgi:hypothetical protein
MNRPPGSWRPPFVTSVDPAQSKPAIDDQCKEAERLIWINYRNDQRIQRDHPTGEKRLWQRAFARR